MTRQSTIKVWIVERLRQHANAALFLAAIAASECALSLSSHFSPTIQQVFAPPGTSVVSATVPDARLGLRPNPAHPGHDANGFRNPFAPTRAEIVALGDSQTYGTGVRPADAWPRQLAALTAKSVYSMAYGGYGPPHSALLLEEAFELRPAVVIEAFYAGNDLYDSFDFVYAFNGMPEMKTDDPELAARISTAERRETISTRVERMYGMLAPGAAPDDTANGGIAAIHDFLSRYSKIYALVLNAKHVALSNKPAEEVVPDSAGAEWKTAQSLFAARSEYCEIFDDGRHRTIFTDRYRLSALDLQDPRILEGLNIALKSIGRMQAETAKRNIRLLVVLIPTKEYVFRSVRDSCPPMCTALAQSEESMWAVAKEYFRDQQIEYVDALPALRTALEKAAQPYPASQDGHPNRHGHSAIAALLAEHL